MGANDDPGLLAYRQKRAARAELSEALGGLGGGSMDILISVLLEEGPEKTLEQLLTAPEKIDCRGVSIRDEEQRKRVEASLVQLAERSKALNDAMAKPRPRREPEYIEAGLGENPMPSRRRSRGRSR
ncbi:MAG: hypothetical protein WCC41_01525 [Rhodomicrobium sp.]